MDVAILIVHLVFLGHVWECHGRSLFGSTLLHSGRDIVLLMIYILSLTG
jgi:hypothetical protein